MSRIASKSLGRGEYFTNRMKEIHCSDNELTMEMKNPNYPLHKEPIKLVFFEEDQQGNIIINYYRPYGASYQFRKGDNKWENRFQRTRLKEPIGDMKYRSPAGGGLAPYFPPEILKKFENKEEIETLFMTEGEFKAWRACKAKFDCIGIPSIHGFYGETDDERDYIKSLHHDILLVINTCKVKNLVFLTDADTLTVKYEFGKELTKRPKSFYSAVCNFRKSVGFVRENLHKDFNTVYWGHIKTDFCHKQAKGLDDLLNKTNDNDAVLKDALELTVAKVYFDIHSLEKGYSSRIFKYFGLNSVDDFYEKYKPDISDNEFTFNSAQYFFTGENVQFLKHRDVDKFMRIGADWVKIIEVPNKFGELESELKPWKISEIERDYNKRFPGFIKSIRRYDGFCNEPDFTKNYQRVHSDCYNLCQPLNHEPEHGEFPNTAKFLKHVFQGEATIEANGAEISIIGDPLTVALDYLTILHRYPKHMLPVPILVSPEFRTGKSTFLKWMNAIYTSNMCILGNDQFRMKFNGHYITKHIIAIDEGFLDVDKKAEKERLKQLATADKAYLENKGMNVYSFPYYGKLMICSNDADNVMKMEEGENRWFVIRVPVIPEADLDPDLEIKMKREINAWLHFLETRTIVHPRSDRLWFKTEWFVTDQFKRIVEKTKRYLDRTVDEYISEMFQTYNLATLKLDLETITDSINKTAKYKLDKNDVKDYLQEKKGLKPTTKSIRVNIPKGFNEGPDKKLHLEYQNKVCRPYTFLIQHYLKQDEIQNMGELTELMGEETPANLPF